MKAKQILQLISEFNYAVADRAEEYLYKVVGDKREVIVDKIKHQIDQVIITFKEKTQHDSPDYIDICLMDETIDLDEEKWKQFIAAETSKEKRRNKINSTKILS